MQGDPLSPILFIMVLHPILAYLEEKKSIGYSLEGVDIPSLAYADDFCILTRNRRSHQKIIQDINQKLTGMGLKIKPSKCRSLSLCAGKPTPIIFKIAEDEIPSLETDEQKFLGRKVFFTNKEKEKSEYLSKIISEKLGNIDNTSIRSEYKLAIYTRYLVPSLRFLLTVHTLTKTTLDHLDSLTERHLKKWAGLPQCATRVVLHYKKALSIPTISDVYMNSHAKAYISTWLKKDERTEAAMKHKIATEERTQKGSKLALYTKSLILESQPETNLNTDTSSINNQKKLLNVCNRNHLKQVELEHKYSMTGKIDSYTKQGDFLSLASKMDSDITWKSYIYNLPRGTLKFILNASINTLPTLNNLKQWGKITSDKCPHCDNKETLFHVLNGCKISLEQGRYTWRHDNLINYLYKVMQDSELECFADLPQCTVPSGGTIPPDIIVTSERPDLVIINRGERTLYLYELTVPYETRIDAAHELKAEKYSSLYYDLKDLGWKVNFHPFEVGSRGLLPYHTKMSLTTLLKLTSSDKTPKEFHGTISKLATLGSYKLFIARKEQMWVSPAYLSP